MDNYRPITLIPIFSKIYEKIAYSRISNFVESSNLLKNEQNGFRKNRNTSLTIFQLIKNVTECVDENIPVCVLFMDMSKAFDFVCHRRLLEKLYRYGIRGSAHEWIKSYLSNRTQCVQISQYCPDNKCITKYQSNYLHNNYGVPQGSILGPLLFLLYINDLPSAVTQQCYLFADDTTIVIKSNKLENFESQINETLQKTIQWLELNNLKANLSKTKLMQFHTRRRNPKILNVNFENQRIDEVQSIKFLGVTLDSFCSWNDHIKDLCSRINRFVFALRRISQVVSKEAALTSYYGYIHSILQYGITMWGRSSNTDDVFIMQKKCIRAIFGLKTIESCRPYFKKYHILSLPCVYILSASIFVYEHAYFFKTFNELHKNPTRSQYRNKLYIPSTKLSLIAKNSYIMCIKIYNKLPDDIKDLPYLKFKKSLKRWLQEKCFYSIQEYLEYK